MRQWQDPDATHLPVSTTGASQKTAITTWPPGHRGRGSRRSAAEGRLRLPQPGPHIPRQTRVLEPRISTARADGLLQRAYDGLARSAAEAGIARAAQDRIFMQVDPLIIMSIRRFAVLSGQTHSRYAYELGANGCGENATYRGLLRLRVSSPTPAAAASMI
jgi:hypothetical protein